MPFYAINCKGEKLEGISKGDPEAKTGLGKRMVVGDHAPNRPRIFDINNGLHWLLAVTLPECCPCTLTNNGGVGELYPKTGKPAVEVRPALQTSPVAYSTVLNAYKRKTVKYLG